MLKNVDVIEIDMPRYKELAVYNVLPLVRDLDELAQYFPDLNQDQLSDRSLCFQSCQLWD